MPEKTRLAGGQEVWKDSLRVNVYGTVDELNSIIGLVRVFNSDMEGGQTHSTQIGRVPALGSKQTL